MILKKGLCLLMLLGLTINLHAQNFKKAGPPVNAESADQSAPAISPDGKMLAFTSNRSGNWKLYVTRREGSQWSSPTAIEAVNSMFDQGTIVGGTCFNYNHTRLYFAAYPRGNPMQSDIYYTAYADGAWQEAVKLPPAINSSGYEGMPSIASDGNRIFFTRLKKNVEDDDLEAKQCKDLFFSSKNGNNEWAQARNMPSPINDRCENSPFILSDCRTLILSSIRPPKENEAGKVVARRFGGYDLYKADNLAQRIWSKPQMLDAGKASDEMHFSTNATNDIAYLALQHVGSKGGTQIYRLDLSEVTLGNPVMVMQGTITDKQTGEPLKAQIKAMKKSTLQVISSYNSTPNGHYFFVLPSKEEYVLDVTKKDYSHKFLEYDLRKLQENKVKNKALKLYKQVELQLNVFDREIYEPLKGVVTVYRKKDMQPLDIEAQMTAPGRYMLELPIGNAYTIQANKKFYDPFSINLDLTGVVQFSRFERDMELKPKKREMEIEVSDEQTKEGMAVEIVITNLDKNEKIVKEAKKNKEGKYVVELREGDEYEINVNSPKGYAFYNKKIDMNKEKKTRKMDVELKPLKAETKLQLKNITFETNSAELNASSYEELERVTKLLKENDNIRIEISAHTDDVGSKSYNEKLSDRRAESVIEYLTDHEVTQNQLEAQGYGETRPLLPNNSEENRAKNRRVELEILEVLEDGTVKQRAESKANIDKKDK